MAHSKEFMDAEVYRLIELTSGYKSIYFNMEFATFAIFFIAIFYVFMAQKALTRVILLLLQRKLRFSMFIGLAASVYPNFYAFWMFFNYINDRFWLMWYSQLVFSATELTAAICMYVMLDSQAELHRNLLWTMFIVAVWHISESLIDQGFENLFLGQGRSHQISRDLMFLIGDITLVLLSFVHLRNVYASFPQSPGLPGFDKGISQRGASRLFLQHLIFSGAAVIGVLVAFRLYLLAMGERIL
eukprot:TRINITY_DN1488_c0_g1_i2.p1 TRINITY_DN1488_c0_g1~~TRINITY_DN1488_c0_g1_i2.p1  ORF type:complete len:243 (+),score=18.98 TRINITY_DN1488_c0_g1_i2:118-846(+)